MKKLIYRLVDLYLAPLKIKPALGLFARDRILRREHMHAAVHMIKRNGYKTSEPIADVGAFKGGSSIFFSKQFPSSRIIGFEPNEITFLEAVKNCKPFNSIQLHNVALDSESGEKDFYVADNNLSSSLNPIVDNRQFHLSQKVHVQVRTLDEFFSNEKGVTLLKLDVQGRELNILQGGIKTLQKTRYILSEMGNHNLYEGGCQYHEVDAFLRENGFILANLTSAYNYEGMKEFDALYKNTRLS